MKNKYILLPLAALIMAGCDYNEENFDGLGNNAPTDVKKLAYTLTDADYKTIAENKKNMAIAKEAGDSVALASIKSKLSLSEKISGQTYLPAFLADKWYTADAGSAIKITYNKTLNAPAYLDELETAKSYKVSATDYESVWDNVATDYFSPSKPAANYLPRILKGAVANPVEGEYMMVEYNYSNTDPSTGGEQEQFNKLSDAVEGTPGTYNVKGTVAATYARGFLLTDNKATILVYQNAMPNVSLGDVVTVKGTTTTYSGLNQFSKDLEITKASPAASFSYPAFTEMDGAAMDAYLKDPTIKAVKITGKLVMSGTNYNLTGVSGATTAIGALSYPVGGVVASSLVDKEVTVTGYAIGFSSNRVNLMVTGIAAKGDTAPASIGVVATSAPGDYTVQGQVVATNTLSYLVNDGSGSILVYLNQIPDKQVGDMVRLSGAVTKYGLNQYSATVNATLLGKGTATHPAPHAITSEELVAYGAAPYARYITYKGVLTISADKKYYNVAIDGVNPATVQGSLAYPDPASVEALNGKSIIVTGYAIGFSSGKYINTMVTSVVENTPARAAALGLTRAAVGEKRYAMYQYTANNWVAATNAIVVNPSDYRQMGIADNNFSATYKADNYLAQFMTLSYPYAQQGETKAAVYNYYDGKATVLSADEYVFTEGAWKKNTNIVTVTEQFVFNGERWNFDPSIVIRLTKGDAETKKFLQLIVDGVKADAQKGSSYVDNYGTAEYYYGCTAYYGNVEMAPSYWRNMAPYTGKSDDEIYAIMKEHVQEKDGFFAYALRVKYPDMDKIEGIDVTVTINFDVHKATGAGVYAIQYLVTGKGQFEYKPDSYKELQ